MLYSDIFQICNYMFKLKLRYPFQAWINHFHLSRLQATNCCLNSRLVVDENDLKYAENKKNDIDIIKQLHEHFRSKTHRFREINSFFRDAKWCFNPLTAKLFNLNFHPLEVVSRWRDPQLQVSENYSDLTKWRSTLFKSGWLMSHFIFTILKMLYLTC